MKPLHKHALFRQTDWFAVLLLLVAVPLFIRPLIHYPSENIRIIDAFDTDEALVLRQIIHAVDSKAHTISYNDYGFLYNNLGLQLCYALNADTEQEIILVFRYLSLFFWLAGGILLFIATRFFHHSRIVPLSALLVWMGCSVVALDYGIMLHPDMAQVFFVTAALVAASYFASTRRIVWLAVAAFAAGGAFACKYTGALLLPILLPLILLKNQSKSTGLFPRLFISAMIFLLLYLSLNIERALAILGPMLEQHSLLIKPIKLIHKALIYIPILSAAMIPAAFNKRFRPVVRRMSQLIAALAVTALAFVAGVRIGTGAHWHEYSFLQGMATVVGGHTAGVGMVRDTGIAAWGKALSNNQIIGREILIGAVAGFLTLLVSLFRSTNYKRQALALPALLWSMLFFCILAATVKSIFDYYLLPLLPGLVIGYIWLIHSIEVRLKSHVTKPLLNAGLLLLTLIALMPSLWRIGQYADKRLNRPDEIRVTIGQWLETHVPDTATILYSHYTYIPPRFRQAIPVFPIHPDDLEKNYIDYIVINEHIWQFYSDTSLAKNFASGPEKYLSYCYTFRQLRSNKAKNFSIIKDMGQVVVLKRTGTTPVQEIRTIYCTFDSLPTGWVIAPERLSNEKARSGKLAERLRPEEEYSSGTSITLPDSVAGKRLLVEISVWLWMKKKNKQPILALSINEGKTDNRWIPSPGEHFAGDTGVWQAVHLSYTTEGQKDMTLKTYLWNVYQNDFLVDDFQLKVSTPKN